MQIINHLLKCSQSNPGNPKLICSVGSSHPFISTVVPWFQLILQWFISHLPPYLSVLSVLNTSSLLCDCHMQWLGPWLTDSQFQQSVSAICAHPVSLLGRNVLSLSSEEFVCGQSHSLFLYIVPSMIQYMSSSVTRVDSVCQCKPGKGIEFFFWDPLKSLKCIMDYYNILFISQ